MSGYVGDLSPKQEAALQQFRELASDLLQPHHDDYFCLRWLRARNFNVQQSKNMLQKSLEWRHKFGIDRLRHEYEETEFLKKYIPGALIGHDKNGGPLWMYPLAHCDVKGLLHGAKKADIINAIIYRIERSVQEMENQSKKLGRNIETHTIIFDFDKFSIRQIMSGAALSLLTSLLQVYESNYPERLQDATVINAPGLFPIFFNLVKPFLSAATIKKVSVYSRDKWKEVLLQKIDAEELPVYWGGTRTDENGCEKCSSMIKFSQKVPEEEYLTSSSRLSIAENPSFLTVDRRSAEFVVMDVSEVGSMLCWEFETENHDIGFAVYYRSNKIDSENEEDMEELVPWERVNSHLVPEDGNLVCKKVGKYILKFDNSYSSYRSKKVVYFVQVLPPEGSAACPEP